jgi:arsenate reductase (thioredoxin)
MEKSHILIKLSSVKMIFNHHRSLIIIILLSGLSFSSGIHAQDKPGKLYPLLFNYSKNLYPEYQTIPEERRRTIEEIANYLFGTIQIDKKATILIIGTNNATRSIMAEAWAQAAAYYYNVKNLEIFSGGTQETHVSPSAVKALEKAGFIIYRVTKEENSRYEIKYSYNLRPLAIYSKLYNGKDMPHNSYGAIFVCPNANLNVPFLKGMNFRTSLNYFDPSAYDNTTEELDRYAERSHQIAVEMFYLFYCIKTKSY